MCLCLVKLGLHKDNAPLLTLYETPPDIAVMLPVVCPEQIFIFPSVIASGLGLLLMICDTVAMQLNSLVAVTEYVPGPTVMDVDVAPVFQTKD